MEKTVGAFEIRRQFGKIVQGVLSQGDRYVVERHGEPVAVLVPMSVYEQWKRGRDRFFDRIEEVAARADMTAEEAYELAAEAKRDARRANA